MSQDNNPFNRNPDPCSVCVLWLYTQTDINIMSHQDDLLPPDLHIPQVVLLAAGTPSLGSNTAISVDIVQGYEADSTDGGTSPPSMLPAYFEGLYEQGVALHVPVGMLPVHVLARAGTATPDSLPSLRTATSATRSPSEVSSRSIDTESVDSNESWESEFSQPPPLQTDSGSIEDNYQAGLESEFRRRFGRTPTSNERHAFAVTDDEIAEDIFRLP